MAEQQSSDIIFTVNGFLHSGQVSATLRQHHQTSLETPGVMIGDEIVTMLLLNTGNTFHGALEDNSFVIVSIDLFYGWRAKFEKDRSIQHPCLGKDRIDYNCKRLIAFPVHIKSPPHFTLGILVNIGWDTKTPDFWALLHLDSCPSSPDSLLYALEFGRHLLALDKSVEVMVYEVPVIRQPPHSNDCGFYPAHFLDIILQDADFYINECFKMAREKNSYESSMVKNLWKYQTAECLRDQALKTFMYYKKMELAINEDRERDLWSS